MHNLLDKFKIIMFYVHNPNVKIVFVIFTRLFLQRTTNASTFSKKRKFLMSRSRTLVICMEPENFNKLFYMLIDKEIKIHYRPKNVLVTYYTITFWYLLKYFKKYILLQK